MTDTPIRLLIVDDHNLFRQGLIRILEDFPQLSVVGQAADGAEALALVDALQPDVVLMDLNMPILSGPDATRRLSASHPATPVIILTVSERDEDLFDAIKAGARLSAEERGDGRADRRGPAGAGWRSDHRAQHGRPPAGRVPQGG